MFRKGKKFAALCFAQVLLLTAGPGTLPYAFAAAQSGAAKTDEKRLVEFEEILFGEERTDKSVESRLRSIEDNMFGKAGSGSVASRLDAIGKKINAGRSSLLSPPMAPTLDTRQWSKAEDAADLYPPVNSASEPIERATESDRATATLRRAGELYSQGRVNDAEKMFRNVLSIDRNSTDAHFNLGAIAESKGDLAAALKEYKTAYQINPSDGELRDAVISVERKLAEAARAQEAQRLQDAEQRKRDQLKGLVAEASSAYKNGQYDTAINKLQQVIKQSPSDPDVHYALAQALKAKGDMKSAKTHLDQALAQRPDNRLYREALADLNQRLASEKRGGGYDPRTASSGGRGGYDPRTANNDVKPFTDNGMPGANPAPAYQRGPRLADDYRNTGMGQMGRMGGDYMETVGFQPMDPPNGGVMPFTPNGGFREARRPGIMGAINSSSVKRAAVGGLAGAAIGAFFGSRNGDGLKRGALKGAIMGGALGLITGGF